jgi:hypothetical protein
MSIGKATERRGEGVRNFGFGHRKYALNNLIRAGDSSGRYLLARKEQPCDDAGRIGLQYLRSSTYQG